MFASTASTFDPASHPLTAPKATDGPVLKWAREDLTAAVRARLKARALLARAKENDHDLRARKAWGEATDLDLELSSLLVNLCIRKEAEADQLVHYHTRTVQELEAAAAVPIPTRRTETIEVARRMWSTGLCRHVYEDMDLGTLVHRFNKRSVTVVVQETAREAA